MEKVCFKSLVSILGLVLFSCYDQPRLNDSIWAGSDSNENYFELNIRIYGDSLLSFVHDDVSGFGPANSIAIKNYERSLCLESSQCDLRFDYLNDQAGILHTTQGSFNLVKMQDFVDTDSFGYHDCVVRYALRRSKYFNSEQGDTIIVESWYNWMIK